MNILQQHALTKLEQAVRDERRLCLQKKGEANGYVFTEVGGVTVLIGRRGDYKVPAVRTYPDDFEAAINAPVLWQKQKERDEADLPKARTYKTGHLSPIIKTDP